MVTCTLCANVIARHGMIPANAGSVPNIIAAIYVPEIIGMKDAIAEVCQRIYPPYELLYRRDNLDSVTHTIFQ